MSWLSKNVADTLSVKHVWRHIWIEPDYGNIFNARVKVVDVNVAYSDQIQSVSKKLLGGRDNFHGGVR